MQLIKSVRTVCCVALAGLALSIAAKADEWNKKTELTFAVPVEIPGVHLKGWGVLPPGTYMFKLMDSQTDRHIVQIFNQEGTKCYATILAIPNYRLKPTGKTVITFRERPAGEPEELRTWFYPGDNSGQEFVYPKEKAMELAKATNTTVLYAEMPVEIDETVVATEPVATLQQATIKAVNPAGEEVEMAQATPPPAPVETPAPVLPATASPLPLIGLLGLMALGGGLGIRLFAKLRP